MEASQNPGKPWLAEAGFIIPFFTVTAYLFALSYTYCISC